MYSCELYFGRERISCTVDDNFALQQPWASESHDHAVFELNILLQGACRLEAGGTVFRVADQQAVLTAPWKQHCVTPLRDHDFDRFNVMFSLDNGSFLKALLDGIPGCAVFSVTDEIVELCHKFRREQIQKSGFYQVIQRDSLSMILAQSFRLIGVSDYGIKTMSYSPGMDCTHQIDIYFESHLVQASAEALAKELHMSRSQLNRVLLKNYGLSFREKLISARMTRAKWLLTHTEKKVEEIADEIGYSSMSAFHEMFKQYYSMTPNKFRMEQFKQTL